MNWMTTTCVPVATKTVTTTSLTDICKCNCIPRTWDNRVGWIARSSKTTLSLIQVFLTDSWILMSIRKAQTWFQNFISCFWSWKRFNYSSSASWQNSAIKNWTISRCCSWFSFFFGFCCISFLRYRSFWYSSFIRVRAEFQSNDSWLNRWLRCWYFSFRCICFPKQTLTSLDTCSQLSSTCFCI